MKLDGCNYIPWEIYCLLISENFWEVYVNMVSCGFRFVAWVSLPAPYLIQSPVSILSTPGLDVEVKPSSIDAHSAYSGGLGVLGRVYYIAETQTIDY